MANVESEEVIGHEQIMKLFKLWVQKPTFAYLFSGPAHVGKFFIAEKLVRALTDCPEGMNLRLHPDIVYFEPEEGKKEIAVKKVREYRMRLYNRPQIAKRMVAFIPQADKMNEEGFNALLKTMEEPPAGAVFVCVAENVNRIPPTIMSRMVHVQFGLVSVQKIKQALLDRGVAISETDRLTKLSRGRPGLAFGDSDPLKAYRADAEIFVAGLDAGKRLAASDRLRKICESTEDPMQSWSDALQACMDSLRKSLVQGQSSALVLGQGMMDAWGGMGGAISPRMFLDAAVCKADLKILNKPTLYPKAFSLSIL